MRWRGVVFGVGLAAVAAGCGARSGAEPAVPAEVVTILEVENDAFESMRISVWKGAERVRLGIAQGLSTTTFVIPRNLIFGVSTLRVEADPIGSPGRTISHQVQVTEGEKLAVRISP